VDKVKEMTTLAFNDNQLDKITLGLGQLDITKKDGNRFIYKLPDGFIARKIRLRQVEIPPTALLVHAENKTVTVNATTFTLDEGNYTTTALLSHLQTKLRLTVADMVVDFNGGNISFVSASTGFTLNFSGGSSYLFGFEKAVTYTSAGAGVSVVAPNACRTDGTSIVDVLSPTFTQSKTYASKKAGHLARVQTSGPDSASWFNAHEDYINMEGPAFVKNFEIELFDEWGLAHRLRGCAPTCLVDIVRDRRPN
jgi:hypothetical protein